MERAALVLRNMLHTNRPHASWLQAFLQEVVAQGVTTKLLQPLIQRMDVWPLEEGRLGAAAIHHQTGLLLAVRDIIQGCTQAQREAIDAGCIPLLAEILVQGQQRGAELVQEGGADDLEGIDGLLEAVALASWDLANSEHQDARQRLQENGMPAQLSTLRDAWMLGENSRARAAAHGALRCISRT
ncbi:hypothetical protein CYMTET_30514 [Cymbomonas tetramitiformis]|uniref:Uncharacterized protein n=1 Tax=Cymbomonas tetramitiformis TaxID=36881 RepID=A0AAE0FIU6_9CHLO|nr:hypothetical protein CYMTET_30514 [Cymbomonas tetramitiformis]